MSKFEIERSFNLIRELKAIAMGLSSLREEDIPVECFQGVMMHFCKALFDVENDMEAYMNRFVYTGSLKHKSE